MTKEQVKTSPDIGNDRPVSRQHESSYLAYYGYPNYWDGPYLWGPTYSPFQPAIPMTGTAGKLAATTGSGDSHLRSTNEVCGYEIHTSDGELGHVKGFVFDDFTWTIRYMEVSTGHWWPGKNVLISPSWIERISWLDSEVHVNLTRELIQSGPEYFEAQPITRAYEGQLHLHYAKFSYWSNETEPESRFALSGR